MTSQQQKENEELKQEMDQYHQQAIQGNGKLIQAQQDALHTQLEVMREQSNDM
jgi:hypothetical protein